MILGGTGRQSVLSFVVNEFWKEIIKAGLLEDDRIRKFGLMTSLRIICEVLL